jgi:hypothetical protein
MFKNALAFIITALLLMLTSMLAELTIRFFKASREGRKDETTGAKKASREETPAMGRKIDDCKLNKELGYDAIPIMDYTNPCVEKPDAVTARPDASTAGTEENPATTVADEEWEEKRRQEDEARKIRAEREAVRRQVLKAKEEEGKRAAQRESQAAQGDDGLTTAPPGSVSENEEEVDWSTFDWNEYEAMSSAMEETKSSPASLDDSIEPPAQMTQSDKTEAEADRQDVIDRIKLLKTTNQNERNENKRSREAQDLVG